MNDITRLKQRVKDRQSELESEREIHKPSLNEKMAEDTPDFISSYDFWCDDCNVDFSAPARKTVHRLYGEAIVCYRAEHDCGNECVRLISHRDQDLYYHKSEKIRRMRVVYAQDTLQADEYGFKSIYGGAYGKFEKEIARQEEELIKNERDNGFRGLSLQTKEALRNLRKLDNW